MTDPSERFAVCELVLRQGSFADDVAKTKAAGVGAIGVDATAVDDVGLEEARRILDGEGIGVSSYMALGNILQGDGGTTALDETARRLDVAAGLGAPGALVVTGALGGLVPSEADTVSRDWLVDAAALALDRGIRIMLEPLHPLMRHLSFVHTLEHGLSLVDGIDGAGVVLDLGHVWWERGLDGLIRDHVADIVSVQLTNVDSAALADFRYERAPLDSGDVPVASLVRLLESAGYGGWYEEEVLVRGRRDQRLDLLRSSREWFERQVGTER
jgi:sugar phosphate isomerase/epimerase